MRPAIDHQMLIQEELFVCLPAVKNFGEVATLPDGFNAPGSRFRRCLSVHQECFLVGGVKQQEVHCDNDRLVTRNKLQKVVLSGWSKIRVIYLC